MMDGSLYYNVVTKAWWVLLAGEWVEETRAGRGGPMDESAYIYWDYQDGWVGVRVEPKDAARAQAMNQAIPSSDRIYLRPKRLWAFRPQHTGKVLEILAKFCPGFPVYLEPEYRELLVVLMQGASQGMVQVPLPIPPRPTGVHVGTMDDLLKRW